MSFDRPLLLLTLLLVPVAAALYFLVRRRRQRYAVSFTNLEVLASVAPRPSRRSHLPTVVGLVALALLGISVAGPHLTRMAPVEQATVILAVDNSRSMLSRDVRPTRLAAAKGAAQIFLERVPEPLRVGVVVFAGDVQVAAFPTTDRELVGASLRAVRFSDYPGTAIGDALARSVELARQAFAEEGEEGQAAAAARVRLPAQAVSILFLSDGRQYLGLRQPEEGIALAREAGVPVYTIALGTMDGGGSGGAQPGGAFGFLAPDPETLRAIARATEGEFFEARNEEALSSAYAELGSRLGRAPRESEVTVGFVAAGAAALLAAALLSASWWPRLP
jgi:Ca-activated chloride channel family protein